MKRIKPVSELYFGNKLGNTQDPDEPYDQTRESASSTKLNGQGSQGGGSQRPSYVTRTGSRGAPSSYPRNAHKLRG